MIRLLSGTLVFCLFLSCKQAVPLSETAKKIIADSITRTLTNYYDDVRKLGLTAEFKYLDSSAEFSWVPPGYSFPIGYDSVARILKQSAPRYKSINNQFTSLQIKVLSPEIAAYRGTIKSIMLDTTEKLETITLLETGLLIKRVDGWKLLNGQTSISKPQ